MLFCSLYWGLVIGPYTKAANAAAGVYTLYIPVNGPEIHN